MRTHAPRSNHVVLLRAISLLCTFAILEFGGRGDDDAEEDEDAENEDARQEEEPEAEGGRAASGGAVHLARMRSVAALCEGLLSPLGSRRLHALAGEASALPAPQQDLPGAGPRVTGTDL